LLQLLTRPRIVGQQFGAEHLERERILECAIDRAIDDTRPADADDVLDLVAIGEDDAWCQGPGRQGECARSRRQLRRERGTGPRGAPHASAAWTVVAAVGAIVVRCRLRWLRALDERAERLLLPQPLEKPGQRATERRHLRRWCAGGGVG